MSSQDNTPVQELVGHLTKVLNDPEHLKLDVHLLTDTANSLSNNTPKTDLWSILSLGEQILQVIQEDPAPLTRLLQKDISFIPFDELKDHFSVAQLERGLKSSSTAIQLLCLAYIHKASDTPSGAAWISTTFTLVQWLLLVWLESDHTEVSETALNAIIALLEVDHIDHVTVVGEQGLSGTARGQGLFWRRMFGDPNIYTVFFLWTTLRGRENNKKAIQKATIAQGRLFDFIVRAVKLDWNEITIPHNRAIEPRYMSRSVETRDVPDCLLSYAAFNMVDLADPLMNLLRRDFLMKLLAIVDEKAGRGDLPPKLLDAMRGEVDKEMKSIHEASDGIHL